ncbi:hypothetical protein BDR07DRAFT_1375978 [Suillus spraguei]|nr:hypothetical protein BDR07DRAFT_1375978 [Suillus spraguei]
MEGFHVWRLGMDQVDKITKDLSTLGSTFVPVFLGSDKTTVSVGTGNNEYYPLYASIGNIHNNVQRAHHNRVAVIGFLAMLKSMTTPEVTRFGDGHYQQVIYGLGPYIVNYEEQVLLEALIEEALSDDLWDDFGIVAQLVEPSRITLKQKAQKIMDDIDHRIAVVTSFSGHGFKQWMGDDSKALMKVYLPAIEGHVPQDVVHTFRALLDFCYLVHRNIITEDTLLEIDDALSHFHHYHEIFKATGVILHFSLPRQHSLMHYVRNI